MRVDFLVGFDRAWITRGLSFAGRVLGRLPERRVESLAPVLLPLVAAARPFGTGLGALVVAAFDAAGRELRSVEVHASHRGLDVPALPAAWAALRLLEPARNARGLIRLADLMTPSAALEALAAAGYSVVSGGDAGGDVGSERSVVPDRPSRG